MARNVIALLGTPLYTEEDVAAEAITPGHLIAFDGDGKLIKHDGDGDATARKFALERGEMGATIDDPYAVGDVVKVGSFSQGMRVYAFTPSGQNLSKGDLLASDGNGRLVAVGSDVPLAQMLEDVNNAAGPGDARIRVEIV